MSRATLMIATSRGLFRGDEEPAIAFAGRAVTALGRAGPQWWALVDGTEVWQGRGKEWRQVTSLSRARGNCILPLGDGALIGASNARLFRIGKGPPEHVASLERAPGREDWYTPWGGPPDVRSLSASSAGLFANVHVGGILRSRDRLETWTQTIDIDSDVHQILARDGLLAAATARGLAISRDGGESWTFDATNLHASYCRAVALGADAVLTTACVGPHGGRAGIYRRSPDRQGGFEKCRRGLPAWFGDNLDTHCVDARGTLAALGSSDGRVFVSEDSGGSWELVRGQLPPVTAVMVA